jgi:hypothetical protein
MLGFGRGATTTRHKKHYCHETSKRGSHVPPRDVEAVEEEEEGYEIFLVQQMHYLLKHKILQCVFK